MKKNIFNKLTHKDIYTMIFFGLGMLLSILDPTYLNYAIDTLRGISYIHFSVGYFILLIFLILTVRLFIKGVPFLKLDLKDKILSFKSFKLLLIGYYIGFLITLSNAFIIVTFEHTEQLLR